MVATDARGWTERPYCKGWDATYLENGEWTEGRCGATRCLFHCWERPTFHPEDCPCRSR